MADYLDLGFMMDLYSDHELEYILWYEAEVVYHGIIKSLGYFSNVQSDVQVKKGTSRKFSDYYGQFLGKKKALISFDREMVMYQVKFLVARAYSVSIRQFIEHGFIKAPLELNEDIGDKSNVSFCYRNFLLWSEFC